jgi:glycosyltransferase involved in cell wall biosynthesis
VKAVLYARKAKADVVHIHAVGPGLLVPFVRLLGMKAVFTHHGEDYCRAKWGRLAKGMLRAGEYLGVRYANRVIVISDYLRQMLEDKYPCQKQVTLIYNGVNAVTRQLGTDYLHRMGLRENNYILAVGRLVPEKGFDLLVRAFGREAPEGMRLVIAGEADHEDEYAKRLKAMCAADGRVCLTGFVKGEALAQLYAHTRLFVLPSSHEGLPISLLEAMSYGCPIVASDIPANREIGLPGGCYFKSGEEAGLQQALREALASGEGGRVHYDLSKYSWQRIAEQTREVYDFLGVKHNKRKESTIL